MEPLLAEAEVEVKVLLVVGVVAAAVEDVVMALVVVVVEAVEAVAGAEQTIIDEINMLRRWPELVLYPDNMTNTKEIAFSTPYYSPNE